MVNNAKRGYYASHPAKSNELFLLQLAQGKDYLQSRAAKSQLIVQNEGFLRLTIQKWLGLNSYIDFDYLLEEARLAFLTAIEKYDLNQDVSIRSYAMFHLKELRRKSFKFSNWIEFNDDTQVQETCFLPNPDFKDFDLKECLLSAMSGALSIIEQEVIYKYFFGNLKKRQIALQRNCSEARICTIVKNALPKLKSHLLLRGVSPGFLELN